MVVQKTEYKDQQLFIAIIKNSWFEKWIHLKIFSKELFIVKIVKKLMLSCWSWFFNTPASFERKTIRKRKRWQITECII